jgi:hypothetical protein
VINLKGRGRLGVLSADGRDILEKRYEGVWAGFNWLRQDPVAGLYHDGNDTSGSMKQEPFHRLDSFQGRPYTV